MKTTQESIAENHDAEIDKQIFWPAFITVVSVLAAMVIFEESALSIVKTMFNFVTNQLGFVYIWAGALFLGAMIWLSFGKYSHVRMGGPEARPEFSRISWIAMFFCSGIGTSLIYWSLLSGVITTLHLLLVWKLKAHWLRIMPPCMAYSIMALSLGHSTV